MLNRAEDCFILLDLGFKKPLQSTLQVGQLISTKGLFTLAFHRKKFQTFKWIYSRYPETYQLINQELSPAKDGAAPSPGMTP